MTTVYAPLTHLDVFDHVRLLDLSARIASELAPGDWRLIVEAARPAADADQRTAALLLLAGPLTDVMEPADEEVLLRAFLPRLSMADRARVLAEVRDDLKQAQRFADCSDRGDVVELTEDVGRDWVATAEQETAKFRSSARWTATQAVQS